MLKHLRFPLLICSLVILGFASCGEDDDSPNNPVIGTIADNIADDPQFSTLAAALERTGLDLNLDQPTTRYTVFAPTDEAFSNAGIDVGALSDEELRNVLLYHVITGTIVREPDFDPDRSEIGTSNTTGPEDNALTVVVDNDGSGGIRLDDNANVTFVDEYVNGVVYAIDQVLMPPSIVDKAVLDGRFTTLLTALERAGLDDVFREDGTYTVFAPTDDAFTAAGINPGDLTEETLAQVLRYHVLPNEVVSGSIGDGSSFPATLRMTGPDGSPLSLIINNDGSTVRINDEADVVATDVYAFNGVIHAIDDVLVEPQDIVDFVTKSMMTDSLEAAVVAANLTTTLMLDGPYTVFAPTNEAFAAVPDSIMQYVDSTGQLGDVLRYHIVLGNIRADSLREENLTTLNDGQTIAIDTVTGGATRIFPLDSAGVTDIAVTNVQATNGVIHFINNVLLPMLD